MLFLQKVIDQVTTEVRQEGVKRRRKGEVQIDEHTPSMVAAAVKCEAGDPHRVLLRRDRRGRGGHS